MVHNQHCLVLKVSSIKKKLYIFSFSKCAHAKNFNILKTSVEQKIGNRAMIQLVDVLLELFFFFLTEVLKLNFFCMYELCKLRSNFVLHQIYFNIESCSIICLKQTQT